VVQKLGADQGDALICADARNEKVAEEGLEQTPNVPGKTTISTKGAAKSGAVDAAKGDADFLRSRWPELADEAIRRIMAVVHLEADETK